MPLLRVRRLKKSGKPSPYCKGSARMLVEGLIAGVKEFRRGRALDVKLVDAVAKQALCLQSLA